MQIKFASNKIKGVIPMTKKENRLEYNKEVSQLLTEHKQFTIADLVNIMLNCCDNQNDDECMSQEECYHCFAKQIYKAGYRKKLN